MNSERQVHFHHDNHYASSASIKCKVSCTSIKTKFILTSQETLLPRDPLLTLNCVLWCGSNDVALIVDCSVGWGCRIHQLLLCRGVRPPPNKCPEYDTKQSDGEVQVMLELWGIQSTPSLALLPGPLWPRVVAPDKGPIYGLNRTKPCFLDLTVFAFKLRTYAKLNCLK